MPPKHQVTKSACRGEKGREYMRAGKGEGEKGRWRESACGFAFRVLCLELGIRNEKPETRNEIP